MATIIGTSEHDNLSGTAGKDSIIGLAGNDNIDGGIGSDTMDGGVGDDVYYVDRTCDVVIEGVGTSFDTVYSNASYSLSANVENLYLQGNAYYGYGNELDNRIVGNADNNYLWGGAGDDFINGLTGNDTMVGGIGNDAYLVDSTSDVVTEEVAAGEDVVYAYANYSLSANVERLYVQDGVDYGAGNELDNFIEANIGNNYLWGGAGNDTISGRADSDVLTGGAGADYFKFHSANEGNDTITDFSRAEGDKIALSAYGFGNLIFPTGETPESLLSSQFATDAGATDSNHRVIYNSSTGALFFDSDGIGANAQVQIASLSTGLALTNSDFQVFA
ncbi:calcium-binding protein [Microcoleus sp. FACHB-672]|uniref:calcium-binding protein n=1 Tax=Microcoleus sp. FACHB-672 TaxID=2692825 RepID=UPI001686E97B|nr:calcium-binding protein [Microcoleus sp. FACHB-672]MBD2040128.1 calcium-binding protein [Microcoleus sp. FACHB-672]